jgi:hypothetical protein
MRQPRSFRLLAFVLLLMLGFGTLPLSPAAAANCSAIGPGANLAGCDLSDMDLSGVNLAGANLRGANLEGTNLDGANLSGANLSNARITEGTLDSANTSGANLRGIRWVAAPSASLTISDLTFDEFQRFNINGTGFAPGADLSLQVASETGVGNFTSPGWSTADANGAFAGEGFGAPCNGSFGSYVEFTVSDGVNTASIRQPILC